MQPHYAALGGDSETPQTVSTQTIKRNSYADSHTRGANQTKLFGADPEPHTAISGKAPIQEAAKMKPVMKSGSCTCLLASGSSGCYSTHTSLWSVSGFSGTSVSILNIHSKLLIAQHIICGPFILPPVFLPLCQGQCQPAQHHVRIPRAPVWLPAHVAMESRTDPTVPPQSIVPCSRLPLSPTKQLSGGQAEAARQLLPARLLGRARPAWGCRQPLQRSGSWQQRKRAIL